MAGDPSAPSSTPSPNQSQRDPVSRLLATIAIVLAIGMILGFLYVGHLARVPGPAGSIGPQGPQGNQGAPGSLCAGATCPINRTYATFSANFSAVAVNSSRPLSNFTFAFQNCTDEGYGTYSCFFSATNDQTNSTRGIVGLTYSITPAFDYVGGNPTLGQIRAVDGQTVNFQLWFQVLQTTGAITTEISILVGTTTSH